MKTNSAVSYLSTADFYQDHVSFVRYSLRNDGRAHISATAQSTHSSHQHFTTENVYQICQESREGVAALPATSVPLSRDGCEFGSLSLFMCPVVFVA